MENVSVTRLDRRSAVLRIERPGSLNSLDAATLRELRTAAHQLSEQPPDVVRVAGAGRAFSAGADFELLQARDGGRPIDPEEAAWLGGEMADAVEAIPAVTVAELRGPVVGGGLVLAAACDLRVAADDTYFSIPEVDLGLPLGWGGVPRLVREIGPALTRELVLTCRPFTAHEALAAGFLNRVVPPEQLQGAVDELIDLLLTKASYPLREVKAAVNEALEQSMAARGREVDARSLAGAYDDPGSQEAASAYLAARRQDDSTSAR